MESLEELLEQSEVTVLEECSIRGAGEGLAAAGWIADEYTEEVQTEVRW